MAGSLTEAWVESHHGAGKLTPAEIAVITPAAAMLWILKHYLRIGRYDAAWNVAAAAAPYFDRPKAPQREAEEPESHAEH